ncbi:MAG: helix-turn-helix domain-containing protein [Candidatus Azotimanducaceae bacterium WSBS_2022_MAG_OTU7]
MPTAEKSPSALLVEARKRLGLSQKEIANKLNLTTTFIKYIDNGEFSSIPKPAFIRGYLRIYAREVELSGDEIVALYDAELQAAEPMPEMKKVTEENIGTSSITGPVLQTSLIGLVGFALIVAIIWWIVSPPAKEIPQSATQPGISQSTQQDSPEADVDFVPPPIEDATRQSGQISQTEAAKTPGTIDNQAPSLGETVADRQEETEQSSSEQSSSEQSSSEQSSSEQDPTSMVADSVKLERTTDGTRNFVTVDADGFDQLELSFKNECWVEIEDNQFGLIYNALNQTNDVLTIYGTAPFEVLLGKATGVEMTYNHHPFELEPFISLDKITKLTVSD